MVSGKPQNKNKSTKHIQTYPVDVGSTPHPVTLENWRFSFGISPRKQSIRIHGCTWSRTPQEGETLASCYGTKTMGYTFGNNFGARCSCLEMVSTSCIRNVSTRCESGRCLFQQVCSASWNIHKKCGWRRDRTKTTFFVFGAFDLGLLDVASFSCCWWRRKLFFRDSRWICTPGAHLQTFGPKFFQENGHGFPCSVFPSLRRLFKGKQPKERVKNRKTQLPKKFAE